MALQADLPIEVGTVLRTFVHCQVGFIHCRYFSPVVVGVVQVADGQGLQVFVLYALFYHFAESLSLSTKLALGSREVEVRRQPTLDALGVVEERFFRGASL